jgi:hypothetical protein
MLPIQFSPLYVGSPYLHKMHYDASKHHRRGSMEKKNKDIWVGGG